jgi:hypothetical protein
VTPTMPTSALVRPICSLLSARRKEFSNLLLFLNSFGDPEFDKRLPTRADQSGLPPLKLSYCKSSFFEMFVVAKVVFASLPHHDLN